MASVDKNVNEICCPMKLSSNHYLLKILVNVYYNTFQTYHIYFYNPSYKFCSNDKIVFSLSTGDNISDSNISEK